MKNEDMFWEGANYRVYIIAFLLTDDLLFR